MFATPPLRDPQGPTRPTLLLPETLPASPVAAAGPAQEVLFRMAFTPPLRDPQGPTRPTLLLPETLPASPVAAAGPAQEVLFRMAFTNEFFVREPEIPDVDVDALWEVFENLNTN